MNGSRRYRVEVQLRLDANSALRFTREQIEAASHGKEPIALLVVGNVAPPVSPRLPYTGGTVVQFVENWKPVREKLVPVVYEYSVP